MQGATQGTMQRTMKYAVRTVLFVTVLSCLSACSLFSRNQVEQPRELERFDEQFSLQRAWSVNVGNGQGNHYNRLRPAIAGDALFVAANNGTVMAVDKSDGRVRWRQRTQEAITGGTGAGGGMVLIGTRDAQVIAMDQDTGDRLWSADVSSEVLAAPQTDGRIVVAQTIDGRLFGLDPATGEQRWVYENTVPALSLRGSSTPVLTGNTVMAGFANGMVAAVDTTNGFLLWEERVAIPQGRYDIERIIDVDGNLLLSGNVLYVSSYQGNLMGLDVQTGRIVWGMPGSSYNALALGLGNIYWVDSFGHVFAVQNNTERTVWENDELRLRRVTSPVTINNYVAVTDYEGYLHLISQLNGRFVSRTRVDRNGVRADVLVDGGVMYVYGNSGRLVALRLP